MIWHVQPDPDRDAIGASAIDANHVLTVTELELGGERLVLPLGDDPPEETSSRAHRALPMKSWVIGLGNRVPVQRERDGRRLRFSDADVEDLVARSPR